MTFRMWGGFLPLLFSACSVSSVPPLPVPSAPRTCALVRGAYCIENVGLAISPEQGSGGTNRVIIYEQHWQARSLVITEPESCERVLSDTVQLLSSRRTNEALEFRVRLATNGSCDLTMTVGNEVVDLAGNGFFTAMTQIRACRTRPCEGPVIGGVLRGAIPWGEDPPVPSDIR